MKIAFDPQIFGWQEYGGISRYAFELASALHAEGGNEVAIFCPLYVNRYLEQAPPGLLKGGRRVPSFPRCGRVYRALNRRLALPALRRFAPDIVHETYYSTRGAGLQGARNVLTVHDMIHERFPDSFSAADPTRREKAQAVARADHVICVSEQTRKDLIDILNVPHEKTSVVHLGFALTRPRRPNQALAPVEYPYVLYVGSRQGYKNFIPLLSAYASSSLVREQVRLVCFGGGAFRAAERDAVAKAGLDPSMVIQIAGGDDVLADCYRRARAFVYPSRYEGFGIPPLEAMSFDCPVACSNVSSIPEVVGDAAELFDPNSVESMAQALERVVGDQDRREVLVGRGRERLERFSWATCARETLKVYRGLSS